jgi:hypothetical protein
VAGCCEHGGELLCSVKMKCFVHLSDSSYSEGLCIIELVNSRIFSVGVTE